MLPQTDCELIAYNAGVETRERFGPDAFPGADAPRHLHTPWTAERDRALLTLGPDLFWTWADRGYYSHHPTSQQ